MGDNLKEIAWMYDIVEYTFSPGECACQLLFFCEFDGHSIHI